MATHMPSSLEIAQEAQLRPITEIAEAAGLLADEIDPYGRYKAKIDLSVLDRLASRPDAPARLFRGSYVGALVHYARSLP